MSPCRKCDAKCCRYFAFQISAPRTKHDIENIRWYLAHKGVTVFIDRRRWHIEVANKCRYLMKNHRCRIYDKRPAICREHSITSCEAVAGDFSHDYVFKNMKEFDKYLEEKKARRKKRS